MHLISLTLTAQEGTSGVVTSSKWYLEPSTSAQTHPKLPLSIRHCSALSTIVPHTHVCTATTVLLLLPAQGHSQAASSSSLPEVERGAETTPSKCHCLCTEDGKEELRYT